MGTCAIRHGRMSMFEETCYQGCASHRASGEAGLVDRREGGRGAVRRVPSDARPAMPDARRGVFCYHMSEETSRVCASGMGPLAASHRTAPRPPSGGGLRPRQSPGEVECGATEERPPSGGCERCRPAATRVGAAHEEACEAEGSLDLAEDGFDDLFAAAVAAAVAASRETQSHRVGPGARALAEASFRVRVAVLEPSECDVADTAAAPVRRDRRARPGDGAGSRRSCGDRSAAPAPAPTAGSI